MELVFKTQSDAIFDIGENDIHQIRVNELRELLDVKCKPHVEDSVVEAAFNKAINPPCKAWRLERIMTPHFPEGMPNPWPLDEKGLPGYELRIYFIVHLKDECEKNNQQHIH